MPQKRKRNHWVPQAYLRAFAVDEARSKIWRIERETLGAKLKPIANVATRFYLYAPHTREGKRDYSFEEKLSNLEGLFGNPFWREVSTGFVDLSDGPIRKGLALLAATMFLRNPRQLHRTEFIHREIVRQLSALPTLPDMITLNGRTSELDHASWPAYRDAGPDDVTRMWLQNAGGAVWLAEKMMRMRWAMQVADEPSFVTSDNPVLLMHPSLRFRGFDDPDTTVVFPLSPTRQLCLDHRHGEPNGAYYQLPGHAGHLHDLFLRDCLAHIFSSREPRLVLEEIFASADEMGFGVGSLQT